MLLLPEASPPAPAAEDEVSPPAPMLEEAAVEAEAEAEADAETDADALLPAGVHMPTVHEPPGHGVPSGETSARHDPPGSTQMP